jgi:peptidoglycan/LPS O-acetylase OafA/YrhL
MLSPPAWTLTIEWLFYLLIALGLSRTPRRTFVFLGLAIAYFIITHIAGLGLGWRYSTLAAGALPFALGASIYHILPTTGHLDTRLRSLGLLTWLVGLLALNGAICILALVENSATLLNITFYLNMVLNVGVIMCLAIRRQPNGRNRLERADRFLGDLSYPTYLLHLPIAFGLSALILGRIERTYDVKSMLLVFMTLAACAAIGFTLNRLVDTPLQKIRRKFRSKQ